MQIKFLKSIVEHLAGKQSVSFVDLLADKKDVNEFLIAKKLGLTINQTRNVLYKLSDFGLVSFIRKKDKRKGWYIYFWTLNVSRSLDSLGKKLKHELNQFESQLKNRKEKRYYVCKTCGIEVNEEVSLFNDFTCSECGEIYELADSDDIVKNTEKEIVRIKKELVHVNSELDQENEKLDKIKERKIKKAEKVKSDKRSKKRAERKKERDKLKKVNEKSKGSVKKSSKKSKKKVKKTKKPIKKSVGKPKKSSKGKSRKKK
jgi:transcription factor E